MSIAYSIIFYTFLFFAVYVQVFFLMTFLEKRRKIIYHDDNIELENYPTVTIVVPCYNEEETIEKTVNSLLELDYPKDKITIFLIDDGSIDNTWNKLKTFENYSNVKIFHKENGGKHTALNLALEHSTAEFFGCLDSDSLVHNQALKRILKYFEYDHRNMAILPSVVVYNPKTIIQTAQKIEYDIAVYIKKMLGFMGGIQVTPGPFSIFRKKVFNELGHYRKAHNTEDQEIALRMQEHGYKIDHCSDAFVYTIAPDSVIKLYRQRLRWIYGFIKNIIDYRRLLFKRKHGAVSIFTLPSGIVSVLGVIFMSITLFYNFVKFIYHKIIEINTVGFGNLSFDFKFDWFFINVKTALFLSIILYILVIVSVLISRKMVYRKSSFPFSVVYLITIYGLVAPFWMMKAIYNAIFSKESSWTFERRVTK